MIPKFNNFDLTELKEVYLVLHKNLINTPDLIDSQFLQELQSHLHTLAQSEGVDTKDHAQWEVWLGKTRL
jgi:hypothetical protein